VTRIVQSQLRGPAPPADLVRPRPTNWSAAWSAVCWRSHPRTNPLADSAQE